MLNINLHSVCSVTAHKFFSVVVPSKTSPLLGLSLVSNFILVKFSVLYVHYRVHVEENDRLILFLDKLYTLTTLQDCFQMVKMFACCL